MMRNHARVPGSAVRPKTKGNAVSCAARKVAVVGGGWAGCAAAVELTRQGHTISLFETARTPGGRARSVELNGMTLDNGQHIMLGAYSETLRLMRMLQIDPKDVLLQLPLQMRYPSASDGMDFVTPRLPAPAHLLIGLLRTRGLAFEDKLSLARFSTTARWMGWLLHVDCSVAELLVRFNQTERLIRLMWRPLCIAALNTPPEQASAQVFLNVLRDSLGARRSASDMLLPRVNLTHLLPQRALTFVEQQGGTVRMGTTVRKISAAEDRWHIDTGASQDQGEIFDAIVVATQPDHAAALLDGIADTSRLTSLAHEPISTCYLQYGGGLRLEQPFFALADDAAAGMWGQFVFDRGWLDSRHSGLLAVVVSASTAAIALGHPALTTSITAQLAGALQRPELASPLWAKVITEKRATFACTPGLARPENATGRKGLVIAGDYTAGDYPATLESAVRSGICAANSI